jgi:type 1 fimbria pilin
VTLTGDSTASGIGVQFFYNGTGPLMMGPDSSSAGTTGQFFIQTTSSAQTLSLPFQAQYIRTGELVPGSANALASITFSYQ